MREGLQKGWVEVTLNDIADWSSGGTPKATEPKYYNGSIPWLIIADLNNSTVKESAKKITQLGLENSSAKWVEIGSILIAMYGSIGKLGIAGIRCTTNQAIAFTTNIWVNIPNMYLFYYLKYNEPELLNMGQGGAQKNISQTILKKYPFLLPPLNEQKRIVAKLDAIMPRIDAVKERLDKVPGILKRFRQSVLTAAVTGKLTERWREEHPEVENAGLLLERVKEEKNRKYKQRKIAKPITEEDIAFPIPSSWNWCRLSEIVLKMSTGPFGTMLHKSDYVDDGVPVINPTNIKDDKLIPLAKMMISKDKHSELSRYALQEGNIVIARRGDLSKCGIVSKNEIDWLCGTGSFFLKIAIDPVYFRIFYVSDLCQAPLNADSVGSTMSNLNQTVLSNIPFPLPPHVEQKEIVRQVDKLFALADKVEAHYQKAKAQVDRLSQSVLAKAFRGELVPQDPNDEPAEKLLERILEEKAKMEAQLKGTRKRGVKKTVKKSEGGT